MTTQREQINSTIHRWLHPDGCWHELSADCTLFPSGHFPYPGEGGATCARCDGGATNPDYTSESSPRSLLGEAERKAVEEFGAAAYWDALYKPFSYHDINHGNLKAATASAEIRATAIFNLIEGKSAKALEIEL